MPPRYKTTANVKESSLDFGRRALNDENKNSFHTNKSQNQFIFQFNDNQIKLFHTSNCCFGVGEGGGWGGVSPSLISAIT